MNQSRHLRKSKLALGLVAALAAAPVFAQSTSAGVGGVVTDAGGAPVAGAEVTITHVESGTVSRATTDANGRYVAHGLRVGGPYTVSVVKQGAGADTEEGIYLELNKVGNVNAQLHSGDATTLGTVAVVGSRETLAIFNPDNKGVGTSISGRALETAVSGNRSIDDIARLDPRITITEQSEGSMSVAGQNNRYNNISVDGLSVGDPFGLQAGGLAFIGSPISADSIAAYDIKVSDYDVTSDSVGANINAVTKSGTNEFHGSVYRAQSNASSMVGKLDGKKYTGYDKNETTGATFGGPIVKDKLFFFVSYEEQEISGLAGVGSDALSTGRLTQSQVDEVAAAFKTIGVDPGTATAAALENKRTVAKLDWNITDSQRASFTFQRTEEAKPQPYSSYAREYSVIMPSNWYNAASKTDNYSVQLFSDWTENFSTELKLGYQKYGAVNGAAVDQPEVYACFSAAACPNNPTQISSSVPWVIAGEDRFRHENLIDSKRFTGTLSGTYYAGSHVIKGGVDFLSNEIANAFGQLLHGSYGFYDKNGNGTPADEILAKDYGTFVKNVLPNGVTLNDLAGAWTYRQISPFLQDTWQVNDNLSIVYGVRLNIPKADRSPPVAGYQPVADTSGGNYNPANPVQPAVWEHYFGYPSNTTLGSGNKVIEPRVAFNYNFNTPRMMQLRGGAGLFQSVPPYVWLTNPYTNNGVVSSKQYTSTNPVTDPFSADPNNQPGVQSSALPPGICVSRANCQIDVLDPNFKLPTAWKFSLGWDAELPWWGLIGTVEYQRIKHKNAIAYVIPNVGTPKGTLPDGRLSYWQTYPNASNTQVGNGSNNGAYPEIYYRSTLLTNTDLGGSSALTFSLDKPMSHGFGGNLSFTYTHATEVNPGTSSQAYSNYNWVARANPNEIVEAPSRYDIKYSLKASLNWEHAFFGDNKTSVSLYYNGHSGQPYSWVFGGNDVNGDAVASNVDLAYIPLVNDPIVTYKAGTTAEQIAAFQAFIDNDPYLASHRGRIAERGSSRQPWFNQVDLGVQQEFPGFFKSNKVVVRLDIYNFLNMLNKDWGTQDGLGFFASRRLVNVADVLNGKYVYDLGTPTSPNWQEFGIYDTYTNPHRVISRWQALLTLKYKF